MTAGRQPAVRRGAPGSSVARFWSHVRMGPACWEWQGARNAGGYGRFQVSSPGRRRAHVLAHRFSWALHAGREPRGLVLHACDNPACVRPDHLREGDQAANMADCRARGRLARQAPRGEAAGSSRVTADLVREWRAWARQGVALAVLARLAGVSASTVRDAVRGRTWRHVS